MNNGMTMMLKSFGFNPDEVKTNIETFKNEIESKITSADNRLAAIEKQNKAILFLVEQIYNACLNEVVAPTQLSTFTVGNGSKAQQNFNNAIADAVATT